jgi:DUF438 domain-containing protein
MARRDRDSHAGVQQLGPWVNEGSGAALALLSVQAEKVLSHVEDMISREEKVLFPRSLELLLPEEWAEIDRASER